jgi:hypothetical protein
MATKSKYRRTRIEIVVQQQDQDAESYRNELQRMMDEVNLRKDTFTPAICIPSASSTGRMTTMIQWQCYAERPKKTTVKDIFMNHKKKES